SSDYQYVEAPSVELYNLSSDPGEAKNLAPQQTAVTAVMKDKLQSLISRFPPPERTATNAGLSPDAAEKLHALGYVAFRSAASSSSSNENLADPKDKLWEFNAILKAGDAFELGRFADGQALLQLVRDKDPNMYLVPFMLGESYLRRGDWQQA